MDRGVGLPRCCRVVVVVVVEASSVVACVCVCVCVAFKEGFLARRRRRASRCSQTVTCLWTTRAVRLRHSSWSGLATVPCDLFLRIASIFERRFVGV